VENFDWFLGVTFGGVCDNCPFLQQWIFSAFFESLHHFPAQNPELFETILAHDLFQTAFVLAAQSKVTSTMIPFGKLVSGLNLNISKLLSSNWPTFVAGHGITAIALLDHSPSFVLTDDMYTSLLTSVVHEAFQLEQNYGSQKILEEAIAYLLPLSHNQKISTRHLSGFVLDII
jgi:hypothetical protein